MHGDSVAWNCETVPDCSYPRNQLGDRCDRALLVAAFGVLVGGAVATWSAPLSPRGTVVVGVVVSVALAGMWGVARPRRLACAVPLAVLSWISVFGWLTLSLTAIGPVHRWLATVPVPYAFTLVAALKYVSVTGALWACHRRDRHRLHIRVGSPTASTGLRIGPMVLRWTVAGPLLIAAVLALFVTGVEPSEDRWAAVGALAPIIAVGALLNALAEELMYRHTLIATLAETTSTRVAVTYSSLVFGVGHLTGNPGGLTGVVYTAVFGAVCAWAMLTTRGMCWNLPIHVAGDLGVLYTLL
jgi:membrane protease YdiL (CAAX protease family)